MLVWDETFDEHFHRARQSLELFRQHRLSINREKFIFAGSKVSFCGCEVSREGIQADLAKARAIPDFPVPTNLTELQSFLGLVDQLADLSAEIAGAADILRGLLSLRQAFVWTKDHDSSYQAVKQQL